MPDPVPSRSGGRRHPDLDAKVAAAIERIEAAGQRVTITAVAAESGVSLSAVSRRLKDREPARPAMAPPPLFPSRRFARKPPPPPSPPPAERARLANLLADAMDPASSEAEALAAIRAAGRRLAALGLSAHALLALDRYPEQEQDRADARRIRARASAVMAAPAFVLLSTWQRGFVFSLSEWTASVSQRQREILTEIEEKLVAAEAAGGEVEALVQARRL